mmetsp:Transcript_35426/g.72203  ORF Transcript_35426/g.72203 Transcript_35426/m.72203 type:complete len:217 (+) Transcript_35426:3-653(+)
MTSWRSRGAAAVSRAPATPRVDEAAIDALFAQYADVEDPDWISLTGFSKIAEAFGLDPETDTKVLVMAWKLKSIEKPGEIAKREFREGMTAMGIDSLQKLKDLIPSFDPGFMEHKEFSEFYRFCFKFNREEASKKTLEKEVVVALLPMLLENGRSPFVKSFCAFLETAPLARVSADEWNSFLMFSTAFPSGNISGIDEDSSWPTLIDDFVEYLQKR